MTVLITHTILVIYLSFVVFQNKLKSSQREKVRQFITFTQAGEKTAINCLNIHDWKLDVAVDNYYTNPERYNREPKAAVDRKRVEQIFNRYKGNKMLHTGNQLIGVRRFRTSEVSYHGGFVPKSWRFRPKSLELSPQR